LFSKITGLRRRRPYPPSFSKIPAKIIEPETGASTCALGSHKCTKYMGNFTINANLDIIIKKGLVCKTTSPQNWRDLNLNTNKVFDSKKIIISKGKEAKRV
jgi:hypothetical protein